MFSFIRKWHVHIFFCIAILFYGLSLLIVGTDPAFSTRWIAFGFHIFSVVMIGILYLKKSIRKRHLVSFLWEQELVPFGLVLLFAEFISISLLTQYPYVSLGDEVRDGGLQALQIANGTLTNIFAYGRYDAHGLILPTITSFFYHLFGSSVLTYRFPSALVASADAAVIFLLLRLAMNKTAAFFGALTLASLPLHLFFGRTQIVVIFSSFWTSVLLLCLYILLQKQRFIDYLFYGTLLGFVFGFHSAVRVVSILILLALTFLNVWNLIKKFYKQEKFTAHLLKIFLLVGFCFIGFGPRLLFTNTTNFFHTSRFVLQQNVDTKTLPKQNDLQTIGNNYEKSLLVWITQPTSSFFYKDEHPVLPLLIAIFFLIGIFYSLFGVQKTFFRILVFLAVSIPFFSSAITDMVNADHRLITLLPIGAIFAGVGIIAVIKVLRYRFLQYFFISIVCIYLLMQILGFFMFRPADKIYEVKDYLSMHVIYFLQSQHLSEKNITNVCMFVSPTNSTIFNYPHYHEQYQYFLPTVTTTVLPDNNIQDNEAYVFYGECPNTYTLATSEDVLRCNSTSFDFSCPLTYQGNIVIHY